jgi:hypothetical protein
MDFFSFVLFFFFLFLFFILLLFSCQMWVLQISTCVLLAETTLMSFVPLSATTADVC